MNSFPKLILFFVLVFCHLAIPASSQSTAESVLSLDGLVYGYNYDYSKKLLKKDRQIKVEGVLDNVTVTVSEDGKKVSSVRTNANGLFYTKIKIGKSYSVEFAKPGYSSILMSVDLTGVPRDLAAKGLHFSGAELLMNSFQSKTRSPDPAIGRLFYNATANCMDFSENKEAPRKQKEYIENSASLMLRAVEKNKNFETQNGIAPGSELHPIKKELSPVTEEKAPSLRKRDSLGKILTGIRNKKASALTELDPQDIASLEEDLRSAREQYELDKLNAINAEDSLRLIEREQVLNAVEEELAGARKLISLQESKISMQNLLLWLAVIFVIVMSVLLLIIFRYSKDKKKSYLLLKEKNQKITDSINYASRIQNSILPSDEEIRKLLPDSFVYFQPKDVVSGDFYWIREVKGKIVFACVDCTGHGVPGAFMSLIGNTLLDDIVQEKQITDPAQILKYLHQGILKALQQSVNQSQVEDGMDISLCVIDQQAKKLSYAGAMNPVYVLNDGEISVLKPDIRSIGGMKQMKVDFEFATSTVPITGKSAVYMFTDGYMDQFGGPENKKFNIPNFKKMILGLQDETMAEQGRVIGRTIKEWQGSTRQIDDMLVIGFRI